MSGERASRVEQAIVRERGLLQATAETKREAFLFLAMLDAAKAYDRDAALQTYEEWRQRGQSKSG